MIQTGVESRSEALENPIRDSLESAGGDVLRQIREVKEQDPSGPVDRGSARRVDDLHRAAKCLPKGSSLVLEVHSGRLRRRATATRIIRDPARARWTRSRPPLHSASSRQALNGRAGWRTTTTLMRREVAAAASRKSPPPRERSCEQRSQASSPPPRRPARRVKVAGRPSRIARAAFLQELELTSPAAAPSARSRATPRAARRRSGAEGGGGVPVAARSAGSRTSAGMGAGRGHRTRLDGTEQLGPRPACGARFTNPRQRGARGPGIGATDD